LETEKTEAAHPNKLQNILRKVTSMASKIVKPEILSVALVGVANGADNIGVYIPLFTGYSSIQVIVTIIVFVLMMAVWCFLGEKITDFPKIKAIIQTYKYFAVPAVFVGLGIYIIIKSGLIA
jgi:cadmium resistance protein CadD (predicted permease)